MFLYGRGTENRTLINRLKAYYFTVKLYPHHLATLVTFHDRSPFKKLVAYLGNDPRTPALSRRCSTTELIGCIEFVSSATIVIDTIHLICIKPGPGLGTSLGILVQLATNLQGSSDPPGVEPVPFYYFGSSNLPR